MVSNIANGAAIDIDVRNKIVYWSDTHAWTINRMNLTSGEVKIILREDIGEIYSLAVEWESGLIYWTDYVYERIEVANADGSSRRTLVTQNVKSPIGIAVDPANGYVIHQAYVHFGLFIILAMFIYWRMNSSSIFFISVAIIDPYHSAAMLSFRRIKSFVFAR